MDFDGQFESSLGMASDKLTSTCARYANTRVFAGGIITQCKKKKGTDIWNVYKLQSH